MHIVDPYGKSLSVISVYNLYLTVRVGTNSSINENRFIIRYFELTISQEVDRGNFASNELVTFEIPPVKGANSWNSIETEFEESRLCNPRLMLRRK